MNDNDNSLKFFNNALKLADSTHNEYYKSICLVDIAETYYETGDFARALPMYKDCLSRAEKEQDPDGISMAENAIGNILIHNGQVQQGITHLRTSLAITTANGVKLQIAQTAGSLSAAYEKLHDFKHALEYHNMYARYQDSVFNETSKRKVQQLQFDYQLEKKQAQIELLNKDKLIEKGRSEKQQTMLWGLVCGLGLLLIIIVLLSRSRQSEKKSKEQFFVQKQEIEEQAQALEALNGFKDKTFSVLSHDLRGPLATFTTTMSLLDDNLLSPEEFSELKPEVNKQLSALNNLLDNLLQWSKSHMKGDVSVHPARVDLHKMLTDNVVLASGAAGGKGIEIETRIPAALYAWADPGQVDIVIRNLLSNAVKFTNPGGRITVSAVVAGAEIQLAFADNGVGLTKDQLDRLFTPAAGNNTYGTGGEKGIGLGLLLCYEFVRANGGTIAATSEPGKGTIFTISLPAAPQS